MDRLPTDRRLWLIPGLLVVMGLIGPLASAGAGDDRGFLGRIFRRGSTTPPSARRVDPVSDRDRTSADLLKPPTAEELEPRPGRPHSVPAAALVPPPANGDPLVTRFAVGRATDGSTFGLFMHIYADGTVMDSSGLHNADPTKLEALRDVLSTLPLNALELHYPGPAAGDLEVIQVVVYQRSKGKIRAVPFSYSGDPSEAPPEIRRLHAALESFQMQFAGEGFEHSPAPALTPTPGLAPGLPSTSPTAGDYAPPPPLVLPR
jgi:hypothetical protein